MAWGTLTVKIVGEIPSILGGAKANVYRFKSLQKQHVIRCHPKGKAVIFSFYAKTLKGTDKLRVILESPVCSQSQAFYVKNKWKRFYISLRNDITLSPLNIYFSPQVALRQHSDVAIALPQVEGGLYATSPIVPEVKLPAISNDPSASGATRNADRAWIDKDKTGFVIDSQSATAIMVAIPTPDTHQIMPDEFNTFLSFWSSDSEIEISIGISGKHGARFAIRTRANKKEDYIVSSIIGGHDQYFVCAVFDMTLLNVIINGAIAISQTIDKTLIFDRTYIGCSHYQTSRDGSGHTQSLTIYSTPLLYPRILELCREQCPDSYQYTYEYMMRYFRYSLTTESELSTFEACLADEGFSYFAKQLDFAVPEIFEQFPPNKDFHEEDIRDWVMAIMKQPGARAAREDYSKIGRTDLSLGYSFPNTNDPAIINERKYRIEFKIWGRKGYKNAPTQPMKYMSDDELVCAFIMIDRRAHPKIADFEQVVKDNSEHPCISIREIPLLSNDLNYFISFHSDSRYRAARMVLNFFLPIPRNVSPESKASRNS